VGGCVPTVGDGDSAAEAVLLGRYVGQIDARIERAWRRPRTPLKEEDFSCRVQIVQDGTGAVMEITLERCNGDARWQLSLVHAIQSASPLPAPPDPTVFTRVLRMNFRAPPYSAQSSQDDYEPALVTSSAIVTP
jgi:TonB C terminal